MRFRFGPEQQKEMPDEAKEPRADSISSESINAAVVGPERATLEDSRRPSNSVAGSEETSRESMSVSPSKIETLEQLDFRPGKPQVDVDSLGRSVFGGTEPYSASTLSASPLSAPVASSNPLESPEISVANRRLGVAVGVVLLIAGLLLKSFLFLPIEQQMQVDEFMGKLHIAP